jgi:hypothetical protein
MIEGVFSSPARALVHLQTCVGEAEAGWLPSADPDPRLYVTAPYGAGEEQHYFECRGFVLDHCDWQALLTMALQRPEG